MPFVKPEHNLNEMKLKSFIFLGDVFKITDNNSVNLFDDYVLKKPNKLQLAYIRKYVNSYIQVAFGKVNRFETKAVPNEQGGIDYRSVTKKYWNYWVIEHSKIQMDRNFELALELSKLELTVLFEGNKFLNGNEEIYAIASNQLAATNFFHDVSLFKVIEKEIADKDKIELKEIYYALTEFEPLKKGYDFIIKALLDFISLKDISERSPFKILGHFSILELLLTTNRQGSNDNTLNNQLQKKINLLNNQLQEKVDFTLYFKSSELNSFELVIEKLYKYRNDIAHGNKSDFEKKLKVLKDKKDTILSFLHLVVKQILLQAIKEPQLIKDLKEC